jgi:hypothetical protein
VVSSASAEIQHMQKALQQMNVHLHHVVSDINGVTGLRILDAILAGERDPKALVKLRDRRVTRSTVAEMEEALKGDYRPEHLFVLRQSLETYRFHQAQIEKCDHQIETVLQDLAQKAQASEAVGDQKEPPSQTPEARRLPRAGRSGNKSANKNQPARRRSIFAPICRRSAGSTSRRSWGSIF